MARYCGCKTVENRVKWAAFAVLLPVAVLFSILWITSYVNAFKNLIHCNSDLYDEYTENNAQKCADDYISALGAIYAYLIIAIVCFITCTIPLYVMCCCTEPPPNGHTLSSMYDQQTAYTALPVDQKTTVLPTNNNKIDII